MIDFNFSLIIQIVNFLITIIVLNYLLYKPIRGIIAKRKATFSGFETDIAELTTKIDDRVNEMAEKMAEARKDGYLKKDELKNEGLEEEKRILAEASEAADSEIGRIQAQIKSEISDARSSLKAEMEAFSMELAQKVLGRSLS